MDDFNVFCSVFLLSVVGNNYYNQSKDKVPISEIVSVSDEAFVILCFEKHINQWEVEAQKYNQVNTETPLHAVHAEAQKYSQIKLEKSP